MEQCKNGHAFNEINTYIYPKTGRRMCRTCHRTTELRRVHSKPENIQLSRDRAKQWRMAYPEKAKSVRANWMARLKAEIVKAKSAGCATCGESSLACLDFHHKDPSQKKFNIGMQLGGFSIKKLRAELPKTIVLCSNCHRKLHAVERITK